MPIKLYNVKTKKIENIDDKDVLDKLYYLTHIVLKEKNVDEIKKYISNLEYKMPLFDIYTSNIYLILRENIYNRVTYNHYRYPSKIVLEKLKDEYNKMNDINTDDVLQKRKINKYKLMIEFLDNFNLDILEQTYYRMLYKYSLELGKNIIFCKRPSFNKYIHNTKPYYSKTQIINLALNMNIIKNIEKDDIDKLDVNGLCNKVSSNDINYNILLEHQKHIIKNDKMGLIQYYSVQGSFFVNRYLRNQVKYKSFNSTLDEIIKPMYKLCITAPAFDKDYILYRFVKEDSYLRKISIGDIFTEDAFMSTTRDPFYRADTFEFGLILMKIRIPKNKKGIALCVETISHFPNEQEIIFPPGSQFKLISRDDNTLYYHTDPVFSSKVKTKYEFEWIGCEYIEKKREKERTLNEVNFLSLKKPDLNTLDERIESFSNEVLDITSRFEIKVNNKKYTVIAEYFDSIGSYNKFYAINTSNGFSLYSLYNGYLLFMIEIGEINNRTQMHINYYVKYNTLMKEEIISDNDFLKLISSVAYYFNVERIVIYTENKPCSMMVYNKIQRHENKDKNKKDGENNDKDEENNDKKINILTGNYCVDFYDYLKHNKKKYKNTDITNIELKSYFSYYDLDLLKSINPETFLNRDDDELYQLYHKNYKLDYPSATLADYYVWLIENKCYLVDYLVVRMGRAYKTKNPFENDYYILDPYTYLYNRGEIKVYGSITIDDIITNRKKNIIPTNEYRLDQSIEKSKLRIL
jgi:hypothetical protein